LGLSQFRVFHNQNQDQVTMKRIQFLLIALAFSFFHLGVNAQEYYIKFLENDRNKINTIVTQTVSIDKIDNGFVLAFANEGELEKIKSLGYTPEILPYPSTDDKSIIMATTIDQMANWDRYPTYEVYRTMMKKFEQDYPNLCKLDSVGTTVQGRKLYVVKISDNVLEEEAEPDFLFLSTIHGDETTGFILTLRLIDYLLSNYGTDDRVTSMVNNIAIYINPNHNPDGTYYSGNHTVSGSRRYNANSYDLNRNFPDPRTGQNPGGPYQPETLAMMAYAQTKNFSLSANYHGGAELANFPWDTWTTSQNAHADHNWFYNLSRQYADIVQANSPSGYFTDYGGVTQGGDWYVITGGRQDYMNYWHHCREITIEVSNVKLLAVEQLGNLWNYNKEAMLTFIERVNAGIHGLVTNQDGEPLNATITVLEHDKDNSHVVTKPATGSYLRMIEPGTWQVSYSCEGYVTQVHAITVPSYTSSIEKNVEMVQAGQTTLNGFVNDAETDFPIGGAKIELIGSSVTPVFTNSQGYYSFGSIPENTYQIKASKADYMSQTVVETLVGESNQVDFNLYLSNAESFEWDIPEGFTFTGGDWTRDNSVAYEGDYSMKSAAIGHGQNTTMQINLNVAGAGEISFARKVSSESNWDFLKFFIDGTEKGSWSGNSDWFEVSYPVTAGNHIFKWQYVKDNSMSNGSDCGWIDNIIFPQTQHSVTFTVKSGATPISGATIEFSNQTLTTNASGKVTFTGVPRGKDKPYTVSKEGYLNASGKVNVKYVDVNLSVDMEPSPNYYNVTFNVSGTDGPIEGASVTIAGHELQTNSAGEAYFEQIAEGVHTYTVDAEGYIPVEDELNVDEDKVVDVILEPHVEPFSVTFHVSNPGSNPIEGAVVTLNGTSSITNNQGEVVFSEVLPGVYAYSVAAEGYIPIQGNVVVDMDKTVEVILEVETHPFNVIFVVKNSEGLPVAGALVQLDGKSASTNQNGKAFFMEVEPGIYNYSVEAASYKTVQGIILVDDDKNVEITLMPLDPLYSVTFYVYDKQNQPIESVSVTFNDENIATDANGKALFVDIEEGDYSYRVSIEGFHAQEGNVHIESDTTIIINLTPQGVPLMTNNATVVEIWPNPFRQWLNIRVAVPSTESIAIDIYSITGQKVGTIASPTVINRESTYQWQGFGESGHLLPGGLYVVKVITGQGVISEKVLFMP